VTSREDGTITVFVSVFMVALLLVAGLVIDGGHLLAARREASDLAESAARAGAQELDVVALRTADDTRLDPEAARRRAERYLASAGVRGLVRVEGDTVHVDVTITRALTLLGIAGIRQATVTASGEAHSERGIYDAGSP
jgi:Flp pilus assembly protein TadG